MNRFLNEKKMEIKEAIQVLKDHNVWRRFDDENSESPKMTDPKKLGVAIDKVISEFENLFISGVVKSLPNYKTIKLEKEKALQELNEKTGYRLTENEKRCFESGFTKCYLIIGK